MYTHPVITYTLLNRMAICRHSVHSYYDVTFRNEISRDDFSWGKKLCSPKQVSDTTIISLLPGKHLEQHWCLGCGTSIKNVDRYQDAFILITAGVDSTMWVSVLGIVCYIHAGELCWHLNINFSFFFIPGWHFLRPDPCVLIHKCSLTKETEFTI